MIMRIFLPRTTWLFSALILVLLVGCQKKEYSTVELERFGDSVIGSGQVRYAKSSYGGCELTIELGLLQPGEDYWLCFNAVFPDSSESIILGNLKPGSPDWPEGQFYDNPVTGEKEGFWNFATITADKYGTFSGTFLLPLPPKKDAYSVKLLVKAIHAGGNVILQAPLLRFVVKSSVIRWGGIVMSAGLLSVGIAIAFVYFCHKRTGKKDRKTSPNRYEWIAKAMLLRRLHPDWTDKKIADAVNIHPSQLSRCKEYQKATKMERKSKSDFPHGHFRTDPDTGLRDVEAYTEDDTD